MNNDKRDNEIKYFKIDKKIVESKPRLNRDEIGDNDRVIINKDTLLELIYTKYLLLERIESKYDFLHYWIRSQLGLRVDLDELMSFTESLEDFKHNILEQTQKEDIERAFNKFRRERNYIRNKEIRLIRNIDFDETDFGDDPSINEEDIIQYDEDGNPID